MSYTVEEKTSYNDRKENQECVTSTEDEGENG